MLEVILNHDYEDSSFLGSKDRIKDIEIEEMKVTEEGIIARSSDNIDTVEINDVQRAHWLGNLLLSQCNAGRYSWKVLEGVNYL
ncbi:MAG: hypothetical protein ACR5K2_02590 [Wolbachia sp.]